jgi:NAD(P)-dependent dehydrogenase (short-subunit alcohol dehydrogenase family)
MGSMKGKVALITGGASGYGNAMVNRFADEGAKVIAADINKTMLEEAKKANNSIDTYVLDVTNAGSWEALAAYISSTYGRIDILINNAGGAVAVKEHIAQENEIIEKIIALNLTSVAFGCKYFGKLMKEQKEGTIINIASDCARHAWPGFGVYAAAKAGVVNFSKGLFVELRPYNVRVTAIIPGAGNTNFSKNAGIAEPDEPYKLGGPELAEAALHICSQPQYILVEEYMLSGTEREIIPM